MATVLRGCVRIKDRRNMQEACRTFLANACHEPFQCHFRLHPDSRKALWLWIEVFGKQRQEKHMCEMECFASTRPTCYVFQISFTNLDKPRKAHTVYGSSFWILNLEENIATVGVSSDQLLAIRSHYHDFSSAEFDWHSGKDHPSSVLRFSPWWWYWRLLGREEGKKRSRRT